VITASGGTDLTNMTIKLGNSYESGSLISVDAGTGLLLFVRPRDFRFYPTGFMFTYAVTGDEYVWIEKYILGPQGMTWFIVGVSVASFIALLILIAIICCIVHCCRNRKKVVSSFIGDGDMTPDSAMRLPGHGKFFLYYK